MVMKKVTLNIEQEAWENFKKTSKINNSDSNKEMRKLIDEYLKKNKEKITKK